MLEISQTLPPKAVLGLEGQRLADKLAAQNALWLRAQPDQVRLEQGDNGAWVAGWSCAVSDALAKPTHPNKQNGRFDPESAAPAMRFETGVHCGYVVDKIGTSTERFSLAVIYRAADADARTLFSVAGEDRSNILFGSDKAGVFGVADRAGTLNTTLLHQPYTGLRYNLIALSYETGKLRVCLNHLDVTECAGAIPGFSGPTDLFIGCRNHRPGLQKTLGSSFITDVIFWPNRVVLGPMSAQHDESFRQVQDFWRWNR